MKQKFLYQLRAKLKGFLSLLILYGFISFSFTQFSNEQIRIRFLYLTNLLYHDFWLFAESKVYASEFEKISPIFKKPLVREVNVSFEFPAIVEATKELQLQSKHSGRIQKIHVLEGQTVKKGQLLAELDDELLKLEGDKLNISLEVSKANQLISFEKWKQAEQLIEVKIREIDKKTELLQVNESEWELSKDLREKKEILWKQGFVSLSELEKWRLDEENKFSIYKNIKRDRNNLLSLLKLNLDVDDIGASDKLKVWKEKNTLIERTEYELSLTNTKILENQIKYNKQLVAESKLIAPKAGKILKIYLKEGELTNHLPFISLIENGDLSISFQVGESDLNLILPGKKVDFYPSLKGSQVAPGKIQNVSGYLEPRTHGIGVKAKLFQNNGSLLTGMFGTAKIDSDITKEIVIVPTKSVYGDDLSGYYLLIKHGDSIEKRFIQCKPYNDFEMEVFTGINADELFQVNTK